MKPNPEYIRAIQQAVQESPFPQLIAMRLESIAFDRATVILESDTKHLQPFGIVHGGVLATVIDTATFWSVFMRIPEDHGLVNVDLKLNYLKSVKNGTLRAEGRAIRSGRSISYAEARVYDERDELLAHGTSTLITLPGKGIDMAVPKFIQEC